MSTDHDWLTDPIPTVDAAALTSALARQEQLTKPPGSLGRLEALGATLAAMQKTQKPTLERVSIVVFAADHGVVAEGVSAYPQTVTAEMVRNFARGGAAISVLARQLGATLEIVNVGTRHPLEPLPGVLDRRIAAATRNFVNAAAMTPAQRDAALEAGRDSAERAAGTDTQLFIGGEMGIGNTTTAAALGCALLGCEATVLAGPGTGLDPAGVGHKAEVITCALQRHAVSGPLPALQRLGGFEIAALVGAYLRCAQLGIPVLVDGFITTVAALTALRLQPAVATWLFYSHRSAEPGHQRLLTALQAQPLLDLGLRLGEGSGAAVALPLLRAAVALHADMATFTQAGISSP